MPFFVVKSAVYSRLRGHTAYAETLRGGNVKNRLRIRTKVLPALLCAAMILSHTAAHAALQDARRLVPLGSAAGISLSTEGVLVVGLSGVRCGEEMQYPARDAGICEGDMIVSIDGDPVRTAEELQRCMERTDGQRSVTVRRGGETLTVSVTPVKSEEGLVRMGVWIRDNMLGIGTLTFFDPESGVYGALGHGINEKNSGELLSIAGGDLLHSRIEGVKRGETGTPGELQGSYEPDRRIGSVLSNTSLGIFGKLDHAPEARPVPVAHRDEIKLGEAKILTCTDGCGPREYSIRICALYRTGETGNRDMLIEVTDRSLLETTGGIVQGMSGSPILQDGMLIGAVTHVLVNNPTKGYGVLIENMLQAAEESHYETTMGYGYAA